MRCDPSLPSFKNQITLTLRRWNQRSPSIYTHKPERLFTWRRSLKFSHNRVIHSVIHASLPSFLSQDILCFLPGLTVNYTESQIQLYRDINVLTSHTAHKPSLEQSTSLCLFWDTHYILMRLGKSLFSFCVGLSPSFQSSIQTNENPAARLRKEGISFGGLNRHHFSEKMTAPLTPSPLQLIGSLAGVTRRDPGLLSLPFKSWSSASV